jgi:hypothetical protein
MMDKDSLHSIVSKYGVVVLAQKAPYLTLENAPKYKKDGFEVRVKCSKCGNVHNIDVKCQVCGKDGDTQ